MTTLNLSAYRPGLVPAVSHSFGLQQLMLKKNTCAKHERLLVPSFLICHPTSPLSMSEGPVLRHSTVVVFPPQSDVYRI